MPIPPDAPIIPFEIRHDEDGAWFRLSYQKCWSQRLDILALELMIKNHWTIVALRRPDEDKHVIFDIWEIANDLLDDLEEV